MLVNTTQIKVRFSEVDIMGVLWHGHYIKYFEDGREAFGKQYDLGYMQMYAHGYMTPIVKVACDYKRPILYNHPVLLETKFIDSPAAKILFDYKLYHEETGEVYATGTTQQIFLDKNRQLYLTLPEFYVAWKKENNLL